MLKVGDIVKLRKIKSQVHTYNEDTYGVILSTIEMPIFNQTEYIVKWFSTGTIGQFNDYLLVEVL